MFIVAFLIGFLIVAIPLLIIAAATYFVEAIAVYKLATKAGRKNTWLAWIPIVGHYTRTYLISDIAGDKEFSLFDGKICIKNRMNSFWIYVAIGYGGGLISSIVGMIPFIGVFIAPLVSFAIVVAAALMRFVYLKDMLDVFKEDKEKNEKTSIIVTIIDSLISNGLVRAIYLCTVMKCDPIQVEESGEEFYETV